MKKEKKLTGYFAVDNIDFKRPTIVRLALFVASALLLIGLMFVEINALSPTRENAFEFANALSQVYLIIIVLNVAVLVYSFAATFWYAKFKSRIPEKHRPYRGFEKHTYSCFELTAAISVILFIYVTVLTFIAFSGLSLLAMFLTLAAATSQIIICRVSYLVYKDRIRYVPFDENQFLSAEVVTDLPEEVSEFYTDGLETDSTAETTHLDDFYE